MGDLTSTAINWLSIHWGVALGLVGGGAGLSVALEVLLNSAKVSSKKLAFGLLHLLSIVSAVATYLLANLPTTDVPAIYGSIMILAQTWHRYAVSPFYNKFLVPYLNYLANQKTITTGTPVTTVVDAMPATVTHLPETESDFGPSEPQGA